MGTLQHLCLLLACLLTGVARSESPVLARRAAENAQARPGVARRTLSAPVIGQDGRIIACSGKDLLALEPNGSVAWTVPLGHKCNEGMTPVTEQGEVYLVAEDKVIKVTPYNMHSAEPASEVFFSYDATPGRSEEIIGLAVSGGYSSLFLTIRNRGVFAFSLDSGLQWSFGPVLDRFGYRMGCYFSSAPVVDHCEGSLYISNTEGQLYSLYIASRQFRWIQDLSSLDKVMKIVPGNSGRLYIVFPRKSIVVGLDVSTGNISWQLNVGPLSNEKILPTVDSNDLVRPFPIRRSKSSLMDATVHSGSRSEHNHVPLLFLVQLVVIIIQAVAVRFCCIFWRKKKLQGHGLQKFLEKRRSLHNKRRVLGKMISHLEQKAVEDDSSNETLGQLGEVVKTKEGVERKLYTSYSLGRDRPGLKQGSSILPLYKSHSFSSSQKESVTIFNTFSDTSTSGDEASSYSDDSESCSGTSSGDVELDARFLSAEEAGPSNTANVPEGVQDECPLDVKPAYRVFTNPFYVEGQSTGSSGNVSSHREELMTLKDCIPSKRNWLKRRRTLSSTN